MDFDSKHDTTHQFDHSNVGQSSQPADYNGPPPYDAAAAGSSNVDYDTIAASAQRCNFFLERHGGSSIKGAWQVDTSLVHVPTNYLQPLSDCNGFWNGMDKNSIKERRKGRPLYGPVLDNAGVRPNLMLWTRSGRIDGDVYVNSGDGTPRMAVIVAESKEDSVKLRVGAGPNQPLRLYAYSREGSVRVWIPKDFQGVVSLSTEEGSLHVAEEVKSCLTILSSAKRFQRCYLGDVQGLNFGATSTSDGEDPMNGWAGPLIQLTSREGSIYLSFFDKDKKDKKDTMSNIVDAITSAFDFL
ncbi:hypothetical protein RhiJN_25088 [Ceratobasidium sp. AG-Ba]|nr:hypothetical protein RhiJN_25088 [Ceratobasidium sp. AG-Ba]